MIEVFDGRKYFKVERSANQRKGAKGVADIGKAVVRAGEDNRDLRGRAWQIKLVEHGCSPVWKVSAHNET